MNATMAGAHCTQAALLLLLVDAREEQEKETQR